MEAIEELATEVDRAEIVAAVEQAAALAASRSLGPAMGLSGGPSGGRSIGRTPENTLRARLDPESGGLVCYTQKRAVDEVTDPESEVALADAGEGVSVGELVEVPAPFGSAARSAARAAREVLETRLRNARLLGRAERYRDRVGKLETGIVRRREGEDLIVDLGPVEGRLPVAEQSRHEVFNPDDTIRASIVAIEPEDPPVILSRIAPAVLAGVIERETPEVRSGVVEVRRVARHPGIRAKVAVSTEAAGVDPVAACLGPGGSRIRAVSRELRGERVDVLRFHESEEEFAKNALRPAEVLSVTAEDGEAGLVATVRETELPRAVGKRGQNVRLASELVGVPLEVVAEGQPRREHGRDPGREPGREHGRRAGRPRSGEHRPYRGRRPDEDRRGRGPERRPAGPRREQIRRERTRREGSAR